MKYQKGDWVKIKPNINVGDGNEIATMVEQMKPYLGRTFEVCYTEILSDGQAVYKLYNNGEPNFINWVWFEDWLEPAQAPSTEDKTPLVDVIKEGEDNLLKRNLKKDWFCYHCHGLIESKSEGPVKCKYCGKENSQNVKDSCPLATDPRGCTCWEEDDFPTQVIGYCKADKKYGKRSVLETDSQCPCPKLQNRPETKFEKAWRIYEFKRGERLVGDGDSKEIDFRAALKEAGYNE